MKCFQCDREAVGVCKWCFLGQCAEHMQAGLDARLRTPIMGCIHQFRGESVDLGAGADPATPRPSS